MKCKQISLLLLGFLLISSNLNAQTPKDMNNGLAQIVVNHIKEQEEKQDNKITIVEENLEDEYTKQERLKKEKEERYLGEFIVTAYCGCKSCNGKWYGSPCKNGEYPEEGVTVACDKNVLPLNTYIEIEGYGIRKCQDTGSKIIKNRLDLYFDSHQKALEFGVKTLKVYLTK